jgi:hypothetical protein
MLRKTLLTLSVSALLGTAVVVPNAALAFGPPPILGGHPPGLGGPPPGLGLGGPAGHPGAGGPAGFRGGAGRGFQGNVHGFQVRSGALDTSRSASYSHSGRYGYGHGGTRYGRWARYGAYAYGSALAYGSAYANSGCYYTYSYRQQGRVRVCSED